MELPERRRAGRPLPTSPKDFPNLPVPTAELNAALNLLLVKADVTYTQVDEAHGLRLSAKQRSRQMKEARTGPSQEFYDAILATVADKLGRTVDDLHAEFDPMLELARNASTKKRSSDVETTPVRPVQRAAARHRSGRLSPELHRNAEWLANLLAANDEARAVDEMDEIFCDFSELVEVLIYLTGIDSGMPAALLEEIGRRDFARSSRLFTAIGAINPESAERIAAVSAPRSGEGEFSVLEQHPMITFGRRLGGVIKKGDIARARRQVVARTADLTLGPESLLGGIIDSGPDGPVWAGKLLSALADRHSDQLFLAVVQLIRHARAMQRPNLTADLYQQLRPEIRTEILVRLSHITRVPNVIGLEGAEIEDLSAFVDVQRQHLDHLSTALLDPRLTGTADYGVGHLLERVSNLGQLLDALLAKDRDQTVQLLVAALRDWDERLRPWTGFPDLYNPLRRLGRAIWRRSAEPAALVADMLAMDPVGGWLLVEALPWLGAQRFRTMIVALTKNHPAAIDTIAQMIAHMPEGRRQLRYCEQLVRVTGEDSDPILRRIVATHALQIRDVLSYFDQHAPSFAAQMQVLLEDHSINNIREMITARDAGYAERVLRIGTVEDHSINSMRETLPTSRGLGYVEPLLVSESYTEIPIYIRPVEPPALSDMDTHTDKLQAMLDELKRNPYGPFGRTPDDEPGGRPHGYGTSDDRHVDKLQAMLDELKSNPNGPFGRRPEASR